MGGRKGQGIVGIDKRDSMMYACLVVLCNSVSVQPSLRRTYMEYKGHAGHTVCMGHMDPARLTVQMYLVGHVVQGGHMGHTGNMSL